MTQQTPNQWANSFFEDLILDGERVPLERVVRQHRNAIADFRSRGLTWRALANLLKSAGAVKEDGRPYSSDHLRVAFDRTSTTASHPRDAAPQGRPVQQRSRVKSAKRSRLASDADHQSGAPRIPALPSTAQASMTDKDVSIDELELVAARLNNLKA